MFFLHSLKQLYWWTRHNAPQPLQGVKTSTAGVRITICSLVLLFAFVYKRLNSVSFFLSISQYHMEGSGPEGYILTI